MERWRMLFIFAMAILFQETQSTDFSWSKLRIECGASTLNQTTQWMWQLDDEFIKTGQNNNVSTVDFTPPEMSTLRSFPKGEKNCYKLTLFSPNRYMIRAQFLYGNYDGLLKPPVFDLTINGQYWTTITTTSSIDEVQYVELIYPLNTSRLEVCLVRLGDHVPFISSLEALQLLDDYYKSMNNDSMLYLQSRISFGGEADVGETDITYYNRTWKLKKMPDYQNLSSVIIPDGNSDNTENQPPFVLFANAITPKNNSKSNDSISMLIPIPLSPSPVYFVFYFEEPFQYSYPKDRIRRIKIYIEGREMGMIEVGHNYTNDPQVVSLYPVTVQGPAANVTLVQAEGSTYPPIINGMEVFASKEVVSTNGGHSHYCFSMLLAVFQIFGFLMLIG